MQQAVTKKITWGSAVAVVLRLMDYRHFKGRAGEEDNLAIDVASMLRVATMEGRFLGTWTCIPHEVGAVRPGSSAFRLAQARYAKAKAMGLITGSGDYVFVWPDGGAWIELKSRKGSLSDHQRDFKQWCIATGSRYAVCRSVAEVEENLISWGALTAR